MPELQPLNKLIKSSVRLLGSFLLYPVTRAVDQSRAAIIEAVCPRRLVQILSRYEMPDGIPASPDKAARLSKPFTVKLWQCQRIKYLGSIAVRGPLHSAFFEGFNIDRPVGFLHPVRERDRVY